MKMAPFPIRKLICKTGKKCLKAIKKLSFPRGQARSPDSCVPATDLIQMPPVTDRPNVVRSWDEDSKSNVTIVTWLDDVRDIEDMENRLNEALELKMKKGELIRG